MSAPSGLGALAENQIRAGIKAGALDNLKGKGEQWSQGLLTHESRACAVAPHWPVPRLPRLTGKLLHTCGLAWLSMPANAPACRQTVVYGGPQRTVLPCGPAHAGAVPAAGGAQAGWME